MLYERRTDRIKALYLGSLGFILLYKRLKEWTKSVRPSDVYFQNRTELVLERHPERLTQLLPPFLPNICKTMAISHGLVFLFDVLFERVFPVVF
ncbi:hypothetical protein OBV_00350 [Oscillibacter valericigenes Sjm18-20]|nr:hypothetical protein OBV_00350 [Oscillibacter valericigenes Sjm18-20]